MGEYCIYLIPYRNWRGTHLYCGYTQKKRFDQRWKAIRAQEVKAFNKNMRHSKRAQSCCQWFGRRLASWELQVLMGFPPEYTFRGNYRERCIQIGNAVCPPVSKAIFKAIFEVQG